MAPKKGKIRKKDVVRQQSAAAFFAENKEIAGFESDGKSLYVSVRELVENGLDAAEAENVCPEIDIKLHQMSSIEFLRKVGSLYTDSTDTETTVDESVKKVFYIRVSDNGKGMAHDDVAQMLGRVLSGTKQGVRQQRGKFGLGAKMVLIWAKQCTGLPIEITTSTSRKKDISSIRLDIDLENNVPRVIAEERMPNPNKWRGTVFGVYMHGNWKSHGRYIRKYLRSMAVITPYAKFSLSYSEGATESKAFSISYLPRTNQVPLIPTTVKLHPSAANLTLVESMISPFSPDIPLVKMISGSFAGMNTELAQSVILSARLDPDGACVRDIVGEKPQNRQNMRQVVEALQAANAPPPSGNCLSGVGEYNMYLGILKEAQPEFAATHTGKVGIYMGHPFLVEVGISIGGKDEWFDEGLNIFRFANKIPLLMDGGSDVITKAAKELKWNNYQIRAKQDRVGVFVSVVSTRVPFKGTGKETISSDAQPLYAAIRNALCECASKIRRKLSSSKKLRDRAHRRAGSSKYIPQVVQSLCNIMDGEELCDNLDPDTLKRKLQEHIDRRAVWEGELQEDASQKKKRKLNDNIGERLDISLVPKWFGSLENDYIFVKSKSADFMNIKT